MDVAVFRNKQELGEAAADHAAGRILKALEARGTASVIAATGASQFEMLDALVRKPIDWSRVVFFHLDEYIALPEEHPASFRRYLKERITSRITPAAFHFIRGDDPDPVRECRRLDSLISGVEIDLAMVGIGENGHLAFNDPPADFETEKPFLVVDLDEACRRQQLGEGWFHSLEEVPRQAISMSIRQILKSRNILCVVPDLRKAEAVRSCLENPVDPRYPASALREHGDTLLMLDEDSASLLGPSSRSLWGLH